MMSVIHGGELWSGLPDFAFPLVNDINRGPPNILSLFDLGQKEQHEIDRQAEEQYTNINTFAALIARKLFAEGFYCAVVSTLPSQCSLFGARP